MVPCFSMSNTNAVRQLGGMPRELFHCAKFGSSQCDATHTSYWLERPWPPGRAMEELCNLPCDGCHGSRFWCCLQRGHNSRYHFCADCRAQWVAGHLNPPGHLNPTSYEPSLWHVGGIESKLACSISYYAVKVVEGFAGLWHGTCEKEPNLKPPKEPLRLPWSPFNDLQIQLDTDSDNNNTQKKRQCKSQE